MSSMHLLSLVEHLLFEEHLLGPLYHGGFWNPRDPAKMTKRGALGNGLYFTPNLQRALGYRKESGGPYIVLAYLLIRNPLIVHSSSRHHEHPVVQLLIQLGLDKKKAVNVVEKAEENYGYISTEVSKRAREQGYDALMQYFDGRLSEVVLWNTAQIRHATLVQSA